MPTIIDVILEASPDSLTVMRDRVVALAAQENPHDPESPSFVRLQQIVGLHFMSMQIFEDDHYDPLLVFENNFDGTPDQYWTSVLSQLDADLRPILACTKQSKMPLWCKLFEPGESESLVPFLKAHSCPPSASHFGAFAQSLSNIQRNRDLYNGLQLHLGTAPFQQPRLGAIEIHKTIRKWACSEYDWLNKPDKPTAADILRSYRWSAVRAALPTLGITSVLVLALLGFLLHLSKSRPLLLVEGSVAVLVSLGLILITGYQILRKLETSDFTQDDPQLRPEQMRLFAQQEDQIVQNHLASIVLVKPGSLRGFLISTVLRALKFVVPIVGANGYLGSMRTIHFAHWTLVGNSGRLLFLSNFDGSWQSYLDDFVDKAAGGLTLAWGNCVGFPRTRNLSEEGAAHGKEFKAWARQSQTQSLLWYSAYKDLTVNQIVRNASIVAGLQKTTITIKEAHQWIQLL